MGVQKGVKPFPVSSNLERLVKGCRLEENLDECLGFRRAQRGRAHKTEVTAQTETQNRKKWVCFALKLFLSSHWL